MLEKVVLAKPRGFCAGVQRAISIVERSLEKFGQPVYVKHQIVHNTTVIKDLEAKGAVFVESLEEVPVEQVVILSAHGSSPEVAENAKNGGLTVIDAVCPLVKKIHIKAELLHRNWHEIILIGKKNHVEVQGTLGHAPMQVVKTVDDVNDLEYGDVVDKISYLTQTTFSVDETKEIIAKLKEKFPQITEPKDEDICYATTNRQRAVKELAKNSDLILVVGSKNSSNSNRLREVAEQQGVKAYLIDSVDDFKLEYLENVNILGITSGASVPEKLVAELVDFLATKFSSLKIENLETVQENLQFALPKVLINE